MKSRLLVILAAALTLVLLSSSMALANDAPFDDSPAILRSSNYLTTYIADIEAQGNNIVKVSFTVRAKTTMDEVGVLQIEIERNAGNGWFYDRTLDHDDYSNFIKQNALSNKSSVTFTGIAGYQYRATITAYAADSGGSDSKTAPCGTTT